MKNLFKTILPLFALLFTFSCNEQENLMPTTELRDNTETIEKLINGFDEAITYAQKQGGTLDYQALDRYFMENIQANGINVRTNDELSGASDFQPTQEFVSYEARIGEASSYATEDDYLSGLNELDAQVRNSNMSIEEKQLLVDKIAFMDAFVGWMDAVNTSDSLEKAPSWWERWGKCAAGTLGGTGLGALGGAAVGGAGCTVVLPIIGTVACGAAGAVVGGVSGALAGAAASC